MSYAYLGHLRKPAFFASEEGVYVVQFLLQELLPVLEVARTFISQGGTPRSHTASTASAQKLAGQGLQGAPQAPAAPSRQGSEQQAVTGAPSIDSVLLLLRAAADTVFLAIAAKLGTPFCQWSSLYGGHLTPVPATSPASIFSRSSLVDPTNLEHCLAAVMCLVDALVADGPWWREAKSKQPLMLIQVLLRVSDVSAPSLCSCCFWIQQPSAPQLATATAQSMAHYPHAHVLLYSACFSSLDMHTCSDVCRCVCYMVCNHLPCHDAVVFSCCTSGTPASDD
jgi:hypothetical protein